MRAFQTLLVAVLAVAACAPGYGHDTQVSQSTHGYQVRFDPQEAHISNEGEVTSRGSPTLLPERVATDLDANDAGDQDEDDLLQWAAKPQQHDSNSQHQTQRPPCVDCFLVVGVKASAIHSFKDRQVIRQTWANATRLRRLNARVVFLGCEPDFAQMNASYARAIQDALSLEKRVYGDLLTHELLDCRDSYYRLVEKIIAFFHWTAESHPRAAYVMVADEDAYVRVDRLVEMLREPATPRSRYYAGQVWATQFKVAVSTPRDLTHKNHVTIEDYPMSELPPFAVGPHYVVSTDVAHFVSRNRLDLRGVGTLEDVSVGFWLLSLLQIHPVRLPLFDNLRCKLCHNQLISYADVSRQALRKFYANEAKSRSLCHGFSFLTWDKNPFTAQLPVSLLTGADRIARNLSFAWDLQWDPLQKTLQIVTTLSSDADESAVAVYIPSRNTYVGFCHELLTAAMRSMPTTRFPPPLCYDHRSALTKFLTEATRTKASSTRHFYALALTNLQHGKMSAAVFVKLMAGALWMRPLVESLMAGVFPDAHIYVLDEKEYSSRFPSVDPDIIFTTVSDLSRAESEPSTPLDSPPSFARVVVIATAAAPVELPLPDNVILISAMENEQHARHLYLPLASLTFMERSTHSPSTLLRASGGARGGQRALGVFDCNGLGTVAATAAQVLIAALDARTSGQAITQICASDTEPPTRQPSLFPRDDAVLRDQQYDFVVAFEDRFHVPGFISDKIVTAFLAGSVPIYYGDSATVAKYFNPRAFIDCGAFVSLHACAIHVAAVHNSPELYKAIRREPPIVNITAFVEVFSWHPEVAEVATRLGWDGGARTVSDRLKEMILSA